MDRFNDSGRRPRPSAGRRRVTRAVAGSLLVAAGLILRFFLSAASPDGPRLRDAGVVLILAGTVMLLLVAAPARGNLLRTRWVSPGLPESYSGPGAVRSRLDYDYDKGPVAAEGPPAVEFDPPPEAAAGETGPP